MRSSSQKILSVLVCLAYSTTQVALSSVAEANFWAERHQQVSPVLNQLPSITSTLSQPLTWSSSHKKNFVKLSKPLRDLLDSIPLAAGNIQDIYEGGANPPVVLVQDIHLNSEAQMNIATIVQQLIDQKQVNLVGVEGAFEPFDFARFRAFSDKRITKQVTQAFLDKNLLAAPSYVGITSVVEPPPFLGVDDKPHYDANVHAYLSTRDLKDKTLEQARTLKTALLESKQKILSPELQQFDAFRIAYSKGEIGLGAYIKKLSAFDTSTDLAVQQFLAAYQLETSLDFKKVENERKTVIEKLAKTLNEKETSALMAESLAYRTGRLGFGPYYQGLKDLCAKKKIPLGQFPAFDDYIRYVLLSDGIKTDALFAGITQMEKDILATLVTTPEEKNVIALSEYLSLVDKLMDFALTPQEWERYQVLVHSLSSMDHRPNLSPFERFYFEADFRSRAMTANLLAATNPGNRILVTGGFHTPEIAQLLREKKISYVVVSPKITKIEDGSGTSYLSVFAREKTPLETLFQGEKLFLSPEFGATTFPATNARLQASIGRRITKLKDVVVQIGKRAYEFHVQVLDDMDPTRDIITLSWKEKFYRTPIGGLFRPRPAKSANIVEMSGDQMLTRLRSEVAKHYMLARDAYMLNPPYQMTQLDITGVRSAKAMYRDAMKNRPAVLLLNAIQSVAEKNEATMKGDLDARMAAILERMKGETILDLGGGYDTWLRNFMINELQFPTENIYVADPDQRTRPDKKGNILKVSVEKLPYKWTRKFDWCFSTYMFNEEVVNGRVYGKTINIDQAASSLARVIKSNGTLALLTNDTDIWGQSVGNQLKQNGFDGAESQQIEPGADLYYNKNYAINVFTNKKPTLLYWLYTTLGINWEIFFQLTLPLTINILAPWAVSHPVIGPLIFVFGAWVFARAHPNLTEQRFGILFVVGLFLGFPFLNPEWGFWNAVFPSMVMHTIYNSMILLARYNERIGRWLDRLGFGWIKNLPLASTLLTAGGRSPDPNQSSKWTEADRETMVQFRQSIRECAQLLTDERFAAAVQLKIQKIREVHTEFRMPQEFKLQSALNDFAENNRRIGAETARLIGGRPSLLIYPQSNADIVSALDFSDNILMGDELTNLLAPPDGWQKEAVLTDRIHDNSLR